MTEKEKSFIEDIKNAMSWIPCDYDLEMDHFNTWDDDDELIPELCGWYPMMHTGSEAIQIPGLENVILITDDEVDENGINLERCFNEVGCFYCY